MKLLLAALLLLSTPAMAADYAVDYEQSNVRFSGIHAGNSFTGEFSIWEASIYFDPSDLTNSQLSATVDLSSATTGNAMYDGTLPQADWFDVKNHPEGTFESTSIIAQEDGSYIAEGMLTLRGITQPVTLSFTLTDLSHAPVTATGTVTLDRLAFDIGKKSDAPAEWVSKDITIELTLIANKQ